MTNPANTAAVDHAITSRMSARAFTQQEVSRELVTEILQVASRAPSGTNTQPWKVYVLQGATRDTLVDKVCAAHEAMRANPEVAKQYTEQYVAKTGGASMVCWASAKPIKTACMSSNNATSSSLMHRWA
jgi:nitroreductase